MTTVITAIFALAAICGLLGGSALIAAGYAEVDKLGATRGYAMIGGGAVLMVACYLYLKRALRLAKERQARR